MQHSPEKLLELARAAVNAARKAGAEMADAAVSWSQAIAVELEANSIKSAEAESDGRLVVRCFYKGGRGHTSLNGKLDESGAREAGRQAARLARQSNPDPDFVSLPEMDPRPQVPGLYDEAVARLGVAEVMNVVHDNLEDALSAFPSALFEGGASTHVTHRALANSLGVEHAWQSTFYDVGFSALLREGDEVGMYYDMDMGRRLVDVAPAGLARRAAELARGYVGGSSVTSGRMDLVLGPLATWSTLGELASQTGAESIQRGRSYMVGMQGSRVASEQLTLGDDAFIEAGISSGAFDGEGAPRQRVTTIDHGIFVNCLHNSYTAGKAGVENTGHGSMGGGVGPTNMQVELGSSTSDEIVAGVTRGIYIGHGSLGPDSSSGDVSASIDFGQLIEDGRITRPVTNVMVSGHIFDFLQNIDAISSDTRDEPGLRLPTMRIRDVQVIGEK